MSKKINLLDLLILWILSTSFASIILLCAGFFHPTTAVIFGSTLLIFILLISKTAITWHIPSLNIKILLILAIALFFRSKPYLFVLGGQDEGVYINMSVYYEKYGNTFPTDKVRKSLPQEDVAQYDDTTLGFKLPGLFSQNLAKSQYVFQFYPLHPIWISIFGNLLGSDNRPYSLVFFSILNIYVFYLFARLLTNSNRIALIFSLLLALSPTHSFFSKFPVSEITMLFFSASGFYYLTKYFTGIHRPNFIYLLLSSGSFFGLFFTHISGFLYIPLFYISLFLSQLFVLNHTAAKQLLIYYSMVFTFYFLSVAYGLIFDYPYSIYNYHIYFADNLGKYWLHILASVIIISTVAVPLIRLYHKKIISYFSSAITRFHQNIPLFLSALILLCLSLSLLKSLQLAYSNHYTGNPTYNNVNWQMAGLGYKSLKFSNFYVLALHLSPIAFLLLVPSVFLSLKHFPHPQLRQLTLYLAFFLFFRMVLTFVTPYQYYFSRYLLSEVIPYSLLFVSIFLGSPRNKIQTLISPILLIFIAVYFSFYSYHHTLGAETDGAHQSLTRIATHLDRRDLLVIDDARIFIIKPANYFGISAKFLGEISTPLSLYYDLNTFKMNVTDNDNVSMLIRISENYNDVFLLSTNKIIKDYLDPIDIISYKSSIFEQITRTIPIRSAHIENNLFLYKMNGLINNYNNQLYPQRQNPSPTDNSPNSSGFKINNLSYPIKKTDKYLLIRTNASTPLLVSVNQFPLEFSHQKNNDFLYQLDSKIKKIESIIITPATPVPKEILLPVIDVIEII